MLDPEHDDPHLTAAHYLDGWHNPARRQLDPARDPRGHTERPRPAVAERERWLVPRHPQ